MTVSTGIYLQITPTNQDVLMAITWFRARKAGDIDGILKTLMDSLQGVAYKNDSQVKELFVKVMDCDPKNPRVEIGIEEIENPLTPSGIS